MSFINKVVVVTGAGSGIGAVISQQFAKLNATLALFDINDITLDKVAETCQKLSKIKVLKVIADVTRDGDVEKGIAKLVKELGKIDVLINCAGIHIPGKLQDEDILEKFDKLVSVNLRSMVLMTNLALPALKASKGTVINIACTDVQSENAIVYTTVRDGIISFTKGAAVELGKFGIRVNAVSPGPVYETNLILNAGVSEPVNTEFFEALKQRTPLNMLVKPEVVAELAVFLASEKAMGITGSNFVADGGMHLNFVVPSPSATEF